MRQAWLLWHRYEGHLVPDEPTSPGENARVLPLPHQRVPEEQILNPAKRTRLLFAGDPLSPHLRDQARAALRQSIDDLSHPQELKELGTALFLDRPLGIGKAPGEPDQTLLLSYEAFSRSIAEERLRYLAQDLKLFSGEAVLEACLKGLRSIKIAGIPLEEVDDTARIGGVSLADAHKVAPDFLFLRTTSKAVTDFLDQYDFEPLARRFLVHYLTPRSRLLIVKRPSPSGTSEGILAVYDADVRPRLELAFDPRQGYVSRGGIESPASGLQVLRVWEESSAAGVLCEVDVRSENIVIGPRGESSEQVRGGANARR